MEAIHDDDLPACASSFESDGLLLLLAVGRSGPPLSLSPISMIATLFDRHQ